MATIDRRGLTVGDASPAVGSSDPSANLAIKTPVRVATTANITLNGLQTIDGVALAANDRVLVWNQTDATQNGIYLASSGNWTRTTDFDSVREVVKGTLVYINEGTLYGAKTSNVTASDPIAPDMTSLTFTTPIAYQPLDSDLTIIAGVNASARPVTSPSSSNFQGSGYPTTPQYLRSDQNAQIDADIIQLFSTDPSAYAIFTLGGSATVGDVVTLNFIYDGATVPVSYTVQTGNTLDDIKAGLMAAILANTTLMNQVDTANGYTVAGGYHNNKKIGYVFNYGTNTFSIDYDASSDMQVSYSVTGSATETITVSGGWFSSVPQYIGGTSTGSGNAQVVAATGFTKAPGRVIGFTAGFTNSGSTTLNVQGTGASTIQVAAGNAPAGALSNLSGGEIVAGTYYTLVWTGSVYVLHQNSVQVAGGSTPSTTYQLPNALDNNPGIVAGRNPGFSPATGSAVWVLAPTGPTNNTPTSRGVTYGNMSLWAGNTTYPNVKAQWLFQTGSSGGVWISDGIFANSGGTGPFTSGSMTSKGAGSANFNSYYLNGDGWSISQSGNLTGNPVLYTSSGTSTPHTFTTAAGTAIVNFGVENAVPGQFTMAGTGGGKTTFVPTAAASGTITFPAATDTLVARDTTDTLTNKTLTDPKISKVIGGTAVGSSLSLQSTSGAGTTDHIKFLVGNNGATEAARITSNGRILVNSTNGGAVSDDIGPLNAVFSGSAGIPISTTNYGGQNTFVARQAGGTSASPTNSTANGAIFVFGARGYGATGFTSTNRAQLRFTASENWTDSAQGTYLTVLTTNTGGTSTVEVARFNPSGGFGVGTTTDPGAGAILANTSIEATTTVKTGAVTVAGLPAAGTKGRRYFVTDANATTFASVVAGGGANNVPVYDDGTNWRIG